MPATRNPSLQILFECPTPVIAFGNATQNPHVLLTLGRVQNPLRLPHKTTLQRTKVARTCGVLCILTSECASRHNSVSFLNISSSKSALNAECFVHFDFEMCFAPQRRALFQHLKSKSAPNMRCFEYFDFEICFVPQQRELFQQSGSEHEVFCTF